jgi:hypothetical protein
VGYQKYGAFELQRVVAVVAGWVAVVAGVAVVRAVVRAVVWAGVRAVLCWVTPLVLA